MYNSAFQNLFVWSKYTKCISGKACSEVSLLKDEDGYVRQLAEAYIAIIEERIDGSVKN